MNLTDLPLEIVGEIGGESSRVYHSLVLAYPRFARSLALGDRLEFAEKFGYDCRVEQYAHLAMTVWTLHGEIHRTDGPAIEWDDGDKEWHYGGDLHRVGGPAIECNGEKEWLVNGEPHRIDGPAIERDDGYKEWWINGEPHRIDGPAIETSNGYKEWYINGFQMTETEFEDAISKLSA